MSDLTASAAPSPHGPLSHVLHQRAMDERIPMSGGLELTHRCNLACVHCYVNLAPNDRAAQRRELTTAEWLGVLDQLADAGVLWVTLTGGEPLLRPDFCEIYRYAHGKGLVLTVYTNATLITQKHLDLWKTHPPRQLEITQYGYTPETYDKVTDAGKSYDRFLRGLERVRTAGVRVTLKAIAMRDTRDEVRDIAAFARREGMGFRFDAVLSPRIDGGLKPLEQRLTPAEVAAIENADTQRSTQFTEWCAPRVGQLAVDDRLYECGAGQSSFTIDPYGKLHVCELSRRPGWDVVRDGFARGFGEGFGAVLAEKRSDTTGCASCGAAAGCSNCVGMAELEGLSPDLGNPYLCQVTDARNAMMFGDSRPTPNGLVRLRLRGEHGSTTR
jgi:MoaA/NifB/PqqE/SkfB family radical SAM enzyme